MFHLVTLETCRLLACIHSLLVIGDKCMQRRRCGSLIVHAKLAVTSVTFYTELVSKSEMLVPCIYILKVR